MNRFFVNWNDIKHLKVALDKEDSAHASLALRLGIGDSVVVCDGCGTDYDGVIVNGDSKRVELELKNARLAETEPTVNITLLQCLPKSGKMEQIIQKCVEVGVHEIVPIQSARSVVKIENERFQSRLQRYNKIALEAAKQSKRGIIPKVHDIMTFNAINYGFFDLIIVAYENEKDMTVKRLMQSVERSKTGPFKIALVIGPEGGFEPAEIDKFVEHGAKTITLGRRTLRTETAGIAALSMILSELEG